jgi:antitoxin component of RelBE/YafQ-DinJ toxin-antitoxin module
MEKATKTVYIQIRVEEGIKKEFQMLCNCVGTQLSDVIRRYIYQCVATERINGVKVVKFRENR